MGVPQTTGVERTAIADMQIGDYIKTGFDRTSPWYFYIGNNTYTTEIPLTGLSGAGTGFFYMVKVDKGLLVGDRVIANTVTWDSLNAVGIAERRTETHSSKTGFVRSLTGGVAYADANGNMHLTTDAGKGAWPVNNEWNKYIVNFPANKITSGKTLDDVFHWNGIYTWCQDTPINGFKTDGANTQRMVRGNTATITVDKATSSWSATTAGFRPVFEYQE